MSVFDRLPQFPFCCFVVDLRTGSLVIAAILIINYALDLISSLAQHTTFWGVLLCVFGLILALYLLFGILKSNPQWIEIYLWGKLIFLIYELIVIVITFFGHPGVAIWRLVIWFLEVYFFLVINSYYQELCGRGPGTTSSTTTTHVTRTTVITA